MDTPAKLAALRPSTQRVYAAIERGTLGSLGAKGLASFLGLRPRTIRHAIQELRAAGLIACTPYHPRRAHEIVPHFVDPDPTPVPLSGRSF